jgi:hypothetical protein
MEGPPERRRVPLGVHASEKLFLEESNVAMARDFLELVRKFHRVLAITISGFHISMSVIDAIASSPDGEYRTQ